MTSDEIWKEAARADGKYLVSSHGRLAKVLQPFRGRYAYADLHIKKGLDRRLLHRLILETFIGPPPSDKHECNHKDGNTANNKVENLEWVTPSENRNHAYQILRRKAVSGVNHHLYGKYGSDNPNAKRYIVTDPAGKEIEITGLHKFCKDHHLDVGTMSNIANSVYGYKTHHKWKCRHA